MKTVYDISKTKIGSHLIASKGYEKINYNAYGLSRHVGISLRRPFTNFKGKECHEDIITIEPVGSGKFNLLIKLDKGSNLNYFHIPLTEVKSCLQAINLY